jgi:hypothetical protein
VCVCVCVCTLHFSSFLVIRLNPLFTKTLLISLSLCNNCMPMHVVHTHILSLSLILTIPFLMEYKSMYRITSVLTCLHVWQWIYNKTSHYMYGDWYWNDLLNASTNSFMLLYLTVHNQRSFPFNCIRIDAHATHPYHGWAGNCKRPECISQSPLSLSLSLSMDSSSRGLHTVLLSTLKWTSYD